MPPLSSPLPLLLLVSSGPLSPDAYALSIDTRGIFKSEITDFDKKNPEDNIELETSTNTKNDTNAMVREPFLVKELIDLEQYVYRLLNFM